MLPVLVWSKLKEKHTDKLQSDYQVSISPTFYKQLLRQYSLDKNIQFQHSLFLRITTLLNWLKSTLLLKNKYFDTHIYLKTKCLQTNKMHHYCGMENAWEAGWVRKRVALIKNLIYARKKRRAWGEFVRDRAKIVS